MANFRFSSYLVTARQATSWQDMRKPGHWADRRQLDNGIALGKLNSHRCLNADKLLTWPCLLSNCLCRTLSVPERACVCVCASGCVCIPKDTLNCRQACEIKDVPSRPTSRFTFWPTHCLLGLWFACVCVWV